MDELNQKIEAVNLKAEATKEDIVTLCENAIRYNFYSVCVAPHYVPFVSDLLDETKVITTTVIGYPFGYTTIDTKIKEAKQAIEDGALELALVMNLGALKDGDMDYIEQEIREVMECCKGNVLKVVIEMGLLSKEEIKRAVEVCNKTFVHYIETCTEYGPRGVTVNDVEQLVAMKNEILEIEASGNVQTIDQAIELLGAGASRIATTEGVSIMETYLKGDDHHETV